MEKSIDKKVTAECSTSISYIAKCKIFFFKWKTHMRYGLRAIDFGEHSTLHTYTLYMNVTRGLHGKSLGIYIYKVGNYTPDAD